MSRKNCSFSRGRKRVGVRVGSQGPSSVALLPPSPDPLPREGEGFKGVVG
jgi:hypothetical protein